MPVSPGDAGLAAVPGGGHVPWVTAGRGSPGPAPGSGSVWLTAGSARCQPGSDVPARQRRAVGRGFLSVKQKTATAF